MKKKPKDLQLLPHYFKGIAFGIIALTLLLVLLELTSIIAIEKHILKLVAEELVLVAFSLLALTREREEDELTLLIRLKSFTAAFIFGVVSVVVNPLTNLIFESEFVSTSKLSSSLISMFLFYFIVFYILKRKR